MINMINNSQNWIKFKHIFSHTKQLDFLSLGNDTADKIATKVMN